MRTTDVIVLDASKRFIEYTHPAKARKLLKDGKAVVYSHTPFTIQLVAYTSGPQVLIKRIK